jgi:hypothetical protein
MMYSLISAQIIGRQPSKQLQGAPAARREVSIYNGKADSIFLLMPYLLNDIRLHSHQVLIIQGPNQAGAQRRFLNFELSK